MRALVVSEIPQLPQAEGWLENLFGGDKELFSRFLQKHSENQVWTDGYGIMCQATALVVGREIQVIWTNHQEQGGFITLESKDRIRGQGRPRGCKLEKPGFMRSKRGDIYLYFLTCMLHCNIWYWF